MAIDDARAAAQATIKRATLAAHKAVEQLDAGALKDLQALYKQAAADLAERIAAHAGPEGNVALQELQSVLAQVNARIRELGQARDALLNESLYAAADLGVKPYAAAAAIDVSTGMRVSNEALNFVRTFVAADGLQLSDRIWRLDRHARDLVVNQLERSIIQGHGAGQAAHEFLARGVPVPADIIAKTGAANANAIGRDVASALMRDAGSPMDNAMRLFRTEINRAHGEAYMMGGEKTMGFAGWRYLLSPAHPKSDICDLLSTQNLHGLGPGVYPSRAKTPWPAHPNTLSFVEIVFKDEITAEDRAGKETPIEALARLTPAQRIGALGQGKAEIFDEGKLRQGMIRTPLASVKKRVTQLDARTP
jgi:hypothetical protein